MTRYAGRSHGLSAGQWMRGGGAPIGAAPETSDVRIAFGEAKETRTQSHLSPQGDR
jgi:hypothetical protein